MPTIELGELGAEPQHDRVWPGEPPSRPGRRRSRFLRVGLPALLAALLATMAAGNPFPGPWREVDVPAPLGATVLLDRDWLFVIAGLDSNGSGQELTGYRLPEGTSRWRTTLPPGEVGQPMLLGDMLVLVSHAEQSPSGRSRVTAVDARTGAISWDREMTVDTVTGAGDLVVWAGPEGWKPPDGLEEDPVQYRPAGTLQAIDPASGRPRWSLSTPAGARRTYKYSPFGQVAEMALVLSSGRVEMLDLATSAVTRTAQLPPPPADRPDVYWYVDLVGDLFVVYEERSATAYGPTGLDRRWSIPRDDSQEYGPVECGAYLCTHLRDNGMRIWDARTGRLRWSDPRWINLRQVGDVFIATALTESDTPDLQYAVEPATGRVLAELGSWQSMEIESEDPRRIGIRIGGDRRAWVTEVDTRTLRTRLLTVLSGISADCGLTGETLHCRRTDGSIGLWQLQR
ncbi:PQQ-binding-like beta-propeller repeat protein [Plantactinospora sp. S1510]|uniref:PQQ-binding-like beta-propeller repeat protein n=1 Tax=Plantactinospora alkalitolerans TaxID=2789879 RepID=A0ABS0GQC1_9ACTN|nr:PQQ-binding-like beta-propeller repeat protein [Plantactinospora alkalitolerans]MBF9128383.1 PQQ-binding-like beta-propeller repeat protein [Plantactinospora alkalitolerans]